MFLIGEIVSQTGARVHSPLRLTVWVVIMWRFFSLWNLATPLIDILLDSVAPEVKTMSLGSAPTRSERLCSWKTDVLEFHAAWNMY